MVLAMVAWTWAERPGKRPILGRGGWSGLTLRGSEVRRGTGKATRASRGIYIRITISVSRFDSGDFGVIGLNVRLRGLQRVTL